MHYGDGAFYRPLHEDNVVQLQVAQGCTHNRCKFCDMYKQPLKLSPREEVLADIEEIKRGLNGRPVRVFLTGGNAFALPMDTLRLVAGALGGAPDIGCFARVTDVARKSDEELAELAGLGFNDVSIGTENGYDPALAAMGKGFSAADIVEQCRRLDAAGMTYSVFYLIGMAGKGKCQDAARATVRVYDQISPQRIMVHTMTPFAGTPLVAEIEAGAFEPAGELEAVAELRTFVAETGLATELLGMHYGNAVQVDALLPKHRDKVLEILDDFLENADELRYARYRAGMRSI